MTATWTIPASGVPSGLSSGDTSEFATPVTVPQTFVVTTAAASGSGSLAYEITAVNGDTTNPNPDTILFQLSTERPELQHDARVDDRAGQLADDQTPDDPGRRRPRRDTLAPRSSKSTAAGWSSAPAPTAAPSGAWTSWMSPAQGLDILSNRNTVQSNDLGIMPDGSTPAPNSQGS